MWRRSLLTQKCPELHIVVIDTTVQLNAAPESVEKGVKKRVFVNAQPKKYGSLWLMLCRCRSSTLVNVAFSLERNRKCFSAANKANEKIVAAWESLETASPLAPHGFRAHSVATVLSQPYLHVTKSPHFWQSHAMLCYCLLTRVMLLTHHAHERNMHIFGSFCQYSETNIVYLVYYYRE